MKIIPLTGLSALALFLLTNTVSAMPTDLSTSLISFNLTTHANLTARINLPYVSPKDYEQSLGPCICIKPGEYHVCAHNPRKYEYLMGNCKKNDKHHVYRCELTDDSSLHIAKASKCKFLGGLIPATTSCHMYPGGDSCNR